MDQIKLILNPFSYARNGLGLCLNLKSCKINIMNADRGHDVFSLKVLCNYKLYRQLLLCSRYIMRERISKLVMISTD
jgi:hypothetical protein